MESSVLPTRRLGLECPVLNTDEVLDLLRRETPPFVTAPAADLHMTVFHVGRPSEIYDGVVRARTEFSHRPLDPRNFMAALRKWLTDSALVIPRDTWARGDVVETLGADQTVAVLRIRDMSPALSDVHESLAESFAQFLERQLNVPNGSGLLSTEPAFGFSGKSWIPHVTLGATDHRMRFSVPPVTVRLDAMRVRNLQSIR